MSTGTIYDTSIPPTGTVVTPIDNGGMQDIILSGQPQEITQNVVDTLSGGELSNIVDNAEYYVPIKDGTVDFIHYEGTNFVDSPVSSTTAIQTTNAAGPINPYDSNVTTIQRGKYTQAYNASVDDGKLYLDSAPKSGSFGQNALYFLGEVNQAVCAASAGIALGKIIDSTLYNLNPDFWDTHGMSSINPETWSGLTHGDDSLGAKLFNFIFGIDPDTGKAQAYMDEDALAYMAKYMYDSGVFSVGMPVDVQNYSVGDTVNGSLLLGNSRTMASAIGYDGSNSQWNNWMNTASIGYYAYSTHYVYLFTSRTSITGNTRNVTSISGNIATLDGNLLSSEGDRYTVYQYDLSTGIFSQVGGARLTNRNSIYISRPDYNQNTTLLFTPVTPTTIDGITNQENATLPNTSNWDTVPNTLTSLQNQYPDMWTDAIKYDQLQPDGTLKEHTYVPVGFPSTGANPWTDIQPTTNTQTTTQTNTDIDIESLIKTLTDTLTRTIFQDVTTNPNPDDTVPTNPTDTGSGGTESPTAPTGNASALWSVYHPSQAQVDSFGAWLWSDNIITQIQQVLQNPMEGIITLHKVFVSPVDSGTGTIVVGRLDSNVASATVSQQYVYVDCGSVNCYEDFGNVFDYSPYTKVSLYLPFIGIVPLNTDDVMRSTINVTYGVDVFTGACLAMVEVSRDGNTVNMYQYSGVASVEYPLTGAIHSGLISGLMGVAGGAISAIASGGIGIASGMAIASGAISAAKTNNAHASSFSGNAGAMGIKIPYLIIERPQTKVAYNTFTLAGYPTNYGCKLSDCSGHVVVSHVHVEGISATQNELTKIEELLSNGILI